MVLVFLNNVYLQYKIQGHYICKQKPYSYLNLNIKFKDEAAFQIFNLI